MGASAREIERKTVETRERMDDNLAQIEGREALSASRYTRIAAAVVGVAAATIGGVLIYRRTHRPTLRERLSDLSLHDLRSLARRLKDAAPSVTVRVNEKTQDQPSIVVAIVREVAPALVATAGTALVQRLLTTPRYRPE